MNLIIGLGPIGASIGAHLVDLGRPVAGLELDARRAAEWSAQTGAIAYSDAADVPWDEVPAVIVAVRLAHQVDSVLAQLQALPGAATRSVLVVTTLSMGDARDLFSRYTVGRLFEMPLSGGPNAARDGSMTLFVAGPEETPAETALITDIAGRIVRTKEYGQPAGIKLFNNTLGAYNALATAWTLERAAQEGMDPVQLRDAIGSVSGQSWMSDNFHEFHDDLLFKDAHLLISDIGELPSIAPVDEVERLSERIAQVRRLLGVLPD